MCGIYGYKGTELELDLLSIFGKEASRRGPDTNGIAYIGHGKDQKIMTHKSRRLTVDDLLLHVGEPAAVIGHARLATMGDHENIDEAHPIWGNGYALVHNGTIPNFRDLVSPEFEGTDSQALAMFISHEPTVERCVEALQMVDRDAPIACAILLRDHLIIARRELPLWFLAMENGFYFGSYRVNDICTQFEAGIRIASLSEWAMSFRPLPEKTQPKRAW